MLWSDFRLLSGTRSLHRPATRTAHTHVYTCTQGHKGGPTYAARLNTRLSLLAFMPFRVQHNPLRLPALGFGSSDPSTSTSEVAGST